MKEFKEEIVLNEDNFRKDYRKILGIPENASEEKIASTCEGAFRYMQHNSLIIEAASILNNPKLRRQYDNGRQKMFLRQQAEIDRKNKEADAEKIAEEKRNKAERDAKRKEERDKKKAERSLERTKKRIDKKTQEYIKKAEEEIDKGTENREKVVYTYTDEETTNKAKKDVKNIFKKYKLQFVVLIAIGAVCVAWNGKDMIEKIKTTFDKNNDNDINYDVALAAAGASLEEQEVGIQANSESSSIETQELIETISFTDPFKDEQVEARAIAINNYFKANNYHKITDEELEEQIRYINGSYSVSTDAYVMQEAILNTFEDFYNNISLNDNYISGVNENGNKIGFGLEAFLVDNSPNKEIVIEVFNAFQNISTSKIAQEQVAYANELLSLEYELMMGLKQNSNGEAISFESLSLSEGFLTGLIFQLGNLKCPSILGENSEIPYAKVDGEQILINFNDLQAYYNPQYNGEYNPDNIWAKYCADLIKVAEAKKLNNSIN